MKESKHKIVIGCEVLLLCMMIGVLGTKAASSNPPSNGVSYGKNNQDTVEGALNDLYGKANYGDATAAQILKGKTAMVGGKKVTGTYEAPSLASQTSATAGAGDILSGKTAYVNGSKITGSMANKGAVSGTVAPGGTYTIPAGYHNGSGKATCSTCEDNGYWKVKTFSELTATCSRPNTSSGCSTSWFTSAKDDLKNCNSTSCEATNNDFRTYLTAALDFEYNEILGYNIVMTCPNNEKCIRYSTAKSATGGADKTTSSVGLGTQGYSYRRSGISTSFGTRLSNNIPAGGFNIGNNCDMDVVGSVKKGEVGLEFVYNCYSNGAHWSNLELKGTSYLLSGYIIYK